MKGHRYIQERQNFLTHLLKHYTLAFSETLTLETDEDFIYLSDVDTYELYLISVVNQGKVAKLWGDYRGKTCYEALQHRTSPCPFCTNHLLNKDQYYIWKHRNELMEADYMLKDKLVEWEGKLVRMEVVMDISNPERTDQVLRRSLDGQNIFMSGMRLLIETEECQEIIKKLLAMICQFFDAGSGFIEYFGEQVTSVKWRKDTQSFETTSFPMFSKDVVKYWESLLETKKQMIIKNSGQLYKGDSYMAEMMERDQVTSFCITPIMIGKRLLGFIGIENIGKYWTEIPVLGMLSNQIAVRLAKEELQRENERIQYFDDTTNYLNFEGFKKKAEQILNDNPDKHYALWYSDLKRFKYINDVCGYEVGDRFLTSWADAIARSLTEYDTFGRISGDKFVVLRCYKERKELEWHFKKICKELNTFVRQFGSIRLELACGAYLMELPQDRLSLNEMLDRANIAEKHIKEQPGSRIAIYDERMRSKVVRELEMEASLYEALEKEEFQMYLQPQIPLKGCSCFAAEALVRWKRQDGELIYPLEFIELFERDGMIPLLDHYMFEQACRYIRSWNADVGIPLSLSVNVSRVTMLQTDFVEIYREMKNFYEIPDGSIWLEFTESVVVENHELFQDIMKELKQCGFWCAMDDFGADQSSLNVLKDIPMDVLKLDRVFFNEKEDGGRGKAVVNAIIQLASTLHMETVAEGVETFEMVELLRGMGCDYIQGYVYSKPIPAEEYRAFAARQQQ